MKPSMKRTFGCRQSRSTRASLRRSSSHLEESPVCTNFIHYQFIRIAKFVKCSTSDSPFSAVSQIIQALRAKGAQEGSDTASSIQATVDPREAPVEVHGRPSVGLERRALRPPALRPRGQGAVEAPLGIHLSGICKILRIFGGGVLG